MKIKHIIVIGAGGHGNELSSYIHDLAIRGEKICFDGFVDEFKSKKKNGIKILGNFDGLKDFLGRNKDTEFHYITATGDNQLRMRFVEKVEKMSANNLMPWILRHHSSLMGDKVKLGPGCCLAPNSIITTRVRMGKHCILNTSACVSHDCVIGDFVNINPGAIICGDVKLGHGCYIGAGATVIDKVSIGEWTIIGAGAVVTKDLPSHVTAVGVPARVIKTNI